MAPNVKKALNDFIDNIPAAKLTGFPNQSKTDWHKDDNFRLDVQGITKTAWNLQIQANRNAPNTSVKKVAPNTLATVLVAFTSNANADAIKEAFKKSFKDGKNENI